MGWALISLHALLLLVFIAATVDVVYHGRDGDQVIVGCFAILLQIATIAWIWNTMP